MGFIVSASRRTDIPAFYFDWFLNRARAGFCEVPNPFNPRQVRRVSLAPDDADCVVFWTKWPGPLLRRIEELDALGLPYYVLFTLNRYPAELEPGLPGFGERIEAFRALAARIGPERVVWRYDPVILSNRTPHDWHAGNFHEIAAQLLGACRRAIFSLLDYYRKTDRGLKPLEENGWRFVRDADDAPETHRLVSAMAETARRCGMGLQSCAETVDFAADGAAAGRCIDGRLVCRLFGRGGHEDKDPCQRAACGCAVSRDIGAPDTCLHGCPYCYATRDAAAALLRNAQHDPGATMLWQPPRAEPEQP